MKQSKATPSAQHLRQSATASQNAAVHVSPQGQLADHRVQSAKLKQLMVDIDASPKMVAQRQTAASLQGGPKMTLQRQPDLTTSKSVLPLSLQLAQRMAEEEESLQGRFEPVQRVEEDEPLQGKFTAGQSATAKPAAKNNRTGLPDTLKSGIESLSGVSMDAVKVLYNSDKPAQLNAHAYAQGTVIHLAPGQEQHLPHEAWHVVQQAQGRVKPTLQMQQGTVINDDRALETEADAMGARAAAGARQAKHEPGNQGAAAFGAAAETQSIPIQAKLVPNALNVVGEDHVESEALRKSEKKFTKDVLQSSDYWAEDEFRLGAYKLSHFFTDSREVVDPFELRVLQSLNFLKDELRKKKSTYLSAQEWKKQLTIYCSNLEGKTDGVELNENRKNYYKNEFKKTVKSWDKMQDQEVINDINSVLSTLIPAVGKSRKIAEQRINTGKKVSNERSIAMHEGANQEAGSKKGVWKVGDSHAKDMLTMDDRKYELTLQDDFQQYLKVYLSASGKAKEKAVNVLGQQDQDLKNAVIANAKRLINRVWLSNADPKQVIAQIKTSVKEKDVASQVLKSEELKHAFELVTKKEIATEEQNKLPQLQEEKKLFDQRQQTEKNTEEKQKQKIALEKINAEIELMSSIMSPLMKGLEQFLSKAENLMNEKEEEDVVAQGKRIAKEILSGMSDLISMIEKANEQVMQNKFKLNIGFIVRWQELTEKIPPVEKINQETPWVELDHFTKLNEMLKQSYAGMEKSDTSEEAVLKAVLENSEINKKIAHWRFSEESRLGDIKYGFDREMLTELEVYLKNV